MAGLLAGLFGDARGTFVGDLVGTDSPDFKSRRGGAGGVLRQSEIPLKGVSEIVSRTDPSLQSWRENAHRREAREVPARGSGHPERGVRDVDPEVQDTDLRCSETSRLMR
jgi:hypothetical protein